MSRTRETDAMWAAFRAATGAEGDYVVFAFGDGPEMMDELADLVLHGPKRATAGLLRDYEAEGAPLPKPGDHAIFLGGNGLPRGIIRTTEVPVGPLSSVDAAFAWDEGEGDRTRADWLDMHTRFFMRQARAEGFAFHSDIETVFERFDLVWPRSGAG